MKSLPSLTRPWQRVRVRQALAFQAGADGFILCAPDDSQAPPGKLFDCRSFNAPIVIVGDPLWRRPIFGHELSAQQQMLYGADGTTLNV